MEELFLYPSPDDFIDKVIFVNPVTNTLDDSLVMAVSRDPLHSDRYLSSLSHLSSHNTFADDQTLFDCLKPRFLQSLSDNLIYMEHLKDIYDSSIISTSTPLNSSQSSSPVDHSSSTSQNISSDDHSSSTTANSSNS